MKVITIGRGYDNDYVVNSPEVSKYNTQIIKSDDGSYTILDMGSVNGTYVNGVRIIGEHPLRHGDSVIVANVAIDWRSLFEESTYSTVATPQVKKMNWILPVVLGSVSLALIVGLVYLMLLFIRYQKNDAKKLDALEKEKTEYLDSHKLDADLKDIELDAYKEALETAKEETAAEKRKKSKMEAAAKKKEEEAAAKIEESETLNKKLIEELDTLKKTLASEINQKNASLKEANEKQAALEAELRSEQEKYRKLNEDQEFIMDNIAVYAAMEDAPYEKVCEHLGYPYEESDAKTVLYKKIKEGEGERILEAINRIK